MAPEEDVLVFLSDFKTKMNIWSIIFLDDRAKNTSTLALLEIPPIQRKKIIEQLQLQDFSDGPIQDNMNIGSDLWIFGKVIKQNEIYIKISLGHPGKSTICISFHTAEHAMKYPYKKN